MWSVCQFVPKFCKRYCDLGTTIHNALLQYKEDVVNGQFPAAEHTPYKMPAEEEQMFLDLLKTDEEQRVQESKAIGQKLREQDEYEITKLY